MFDKVADRYDLLNDVLSLGQDRWWRRMVAQAVDARAGERVLDVAAGTGTSSLAVHRGRAPTAWPATSRSACWAWACSVGAGPDLEFVAGDAMRLPFRDAAFDAVTISFGLRNVADHQAALAELLRVTRPGGRLVVCEFGHLPWPRLNAVYDAYLAGALPAVARRLSGNPAAYEYLAESIQDWPAQPELARRIAAAGWSAVRWRDLSLGVVAIHRARRPG